MDDTTASLSIPAKLSAINRAYDFLENATIALNRAERYAIQPELAAASVDLARAWIDVSKQYATLAAL